MSVFSFFVVYMFAKVFTHDAFLKALYRSVKDIRGALPAYR